MMKTRQPSRRAADRRAVPPQTTPAQRVTQPVELDERQLKQISGGNTAARTLPKGGW